MSNSLTDLEGRRRFIAGMSAALAGLSSPQPVLGQSTPQYGIEGHIAPELELDYWIDRNGEPGSFSVTDSRGKWVMLKCFQDWCPGCHSSGFPTLKAFADRFAHHHDVVIAGIQTVFEGFSANTVEDVRKLQLQYDLPILMGHDPGDPEGDHRPQTMIKYRTGGTPWIILINPQGRVVYNHFHVNSDRLIAYVDEQIS
ncbi:MAG: peroxiredoxin family protein [bacterium]